MTSKIEWLRSADGKPGYTINPVKGLCPMDCKDNQGKSYCYARRMYDRFKWNPEITWRPEVFEQLAGLPDNSKVFVGSTFELFGDWLPELYLHSIFNFVEVLQRHTFIFLTKQPQNLIKWSPFPENCWVGVSATDEGQYLVAYHTLPKVQAKVKLLSFEPLLGPVLVGAESLQRMGIGWLIIGAQTPVKPATAPKLEWVQEVVQAADKAGVPVFLKDNLYPLLRLKRLDGLIPTGLCANYGHSLRQEFPA